MDRFKKHSYSAFFSHSVVVVLCRHYNVVCVEQKKGKAIVSEVETYLFYARKRITFL